MLRRTVILLFLLLTALVAAQGGMIGNSAVSGSDVSRNPDLAGVSVEQLIGSRMPIDAALIDDHGHKTNPGRLLRGRPIVLLPIFYLCNGVCTTEMQGVLGALSKNPKLVPGRDLDIVVLGLNPKETPELAATKKTEYLDQDGRKETADGWTFLTGPQPEVTKVASALGIHYTYDAAKNRVNHPSAVLILTPEGRVSSYMLGGMYPAARFAEDVARAAKDELGTTDDTTWLGCVHVDPVTGKRSIVVQGVMRLLAVVVVLGILTTMVVQSRRKGGEARAEDGASKESTDSEA